MKRSAIGILGGMGPQASAYMYKLLIEMAQKEFGAKNNDDFPEIILYSVPIPDFISSLEKKEEALNILKGKVRDLNKIKPICYAVACNTAHILINDLQKATKVSFISIVTEVTNEVKKDGRKKIGLMGSFSLINSNIYEKALEKLGIEVLIPDKKELSMLESVARNIIAGNRLQKDIKILLKIVGSLRHRGADGVILGCTELPLIFPQKYSLPVYNSTEILSRALLRKYYE
jgi:aspartate racemase